MARVNLCGFETGNGNESFTFVGTTAVQGTTVRTGQHALQVNPTGTGTGFFRLGLLNADGTHTFASVTTSYLRFYFLYTILPASGSEQICEVLAGGGSAKIEMRIDSAGKLSCYQVTTQLGSTGSTALVINRWYCIEFKVGSGATAAWEIRIDGAVEISGTDTLADSGTSGLWSLGKGINRNSNSVEFYYDDMTIDDAAYPGPGAIIRVDPAADVAKTNWLNQAASSTNEFSSVADYASGGAGDDGDTTYVVTSTAGTQTFTVSFTALTIPRMRGINEIKLFTSCRDTGTVNAYQIQLRPASNAQSTTTLDGGNTYEQRAILYKTIGGTDVLSIANVNTCQASIIKTQSQGRELRCTAMALMLDIPVINGPPVNVNQAVKRGAFF